MHRTAQEGKTSTYLELCGATRRVMGSAIAPVSIEDAQSSRMEERLEARTEVDIAALRGRYRGFDFVVD